MTLRRSRKRRAAKQASKAAKRAAQRAPGRTPLALIAGALGLAVVIAAVLRRRSGDADLPDYGPPNESVPSHETLAPSKNAAGQEAPDPDAAGQAS